MSTESVLQKAREAFPGFNCEIIHTGGNCTALAIFMNTTDHWMITDDAQAPDSMVTPVVVGFYVDCGDWICFDAANARQAFRLIESMFNYQMGEQYGSGPAIAKATGEQP